MKKTLAIISAILVLGVVAWFVASQNHQVSGPAIPAPASSSATQALPLSVTPNFSRGTAPQYLAPVKNASTGVTVSFKPIQTNAPNSAAQIFVDKKQVGEVGGFDISMNGFSPDNNYLAITWESVSGADRKDFGVNVVDVRRGIETILKPKIQAVPYASSQYKPIDLDSYIDSVAWSGDHTLDIRSYFLWPAFNDASHTIAYYRASPEETWRFDLLTGSSTLVTSTP